MKQRQTIQTTLLFVVLSIAIVLSGCAPLAPRGQAPAPAAQGGAAPSGRGESAASGGGAAAGAAAPAADSARPAPTRNAPATIYGSAAPASAPDRTGQYEAVTAGVTDDNEQWNDYQDYLNRHYYIYANKRDVSERYTIHVVDEASIPVHDATVEIYVGDQPFFSGRTDAGGQLFFHPRALDNTWQSEQAREFRVVATKGYVARSETFARYGNDQWMISLTEPARLNYAQLDLLFLMDATGSMDDEIDKIKASMADIADQLAGLPERPDVRYGLVAYRDRGDAFVVRPYDFTSNLADFQRNLAALRADGGGDTPEALNEALHRSLNDLSWRSEDTVRLVLLVADAPPHLDYYWEGFSYDTDMIEAVRRGIKIFPIGASNLDEEGEYVFRQLAQFTGGKFVFLTYAEGSDPSSGPGTETDHDVDNYSVDTLDRLVVRLVREELAKLSTVVAVQPQQQGQTQSYPAPTPTPTPVPQPGSPSGAVTCTIDLTRDSNDCDWTGAIRTLEQGYGQGLFQVTLDPRTTGFTRARFDITFESVPAGWSVNIGDSVSNDGYGGDSGHQSNDAEMQIVDGALQLYGNDNTPARETTDGNRLLRTLEDVVRRGETISLEVGNERLGVNSAGGIEVIDSLYLFALDRQPDREGPVNYDLFAAFNRTIGGGRNGSGVSKVVVTLYPAR